MRVGDSFLRTDWTVVEVTTFIASVLKDLSKSRSGQLRICEGF